MSVHGDPCPEGLPWAQSCFRHAKHSDFKRRPHSPRDLALPAIALGAALDAIEKLRGETAYVAEGGPLEIDHKFVRLPRKAYERLLSQATAQPKPSPSRPQLPQEALVALCVSVATILAIVALVAGCGVVWALR